MAKKPVKQGSPARPNKKIDKTLSEAQRNNPRNPLQLTNELAQHVAVMWTHNLTDEVIHTSLGIPNKTFYKWLKENRTVTIQIRMGDTKQKLTLGFKELKDRMKAFFEPGYLMRLESVVDKAENNDDFRTASSNLRWLLAKRLPRKYGREAESRIGSDQIEAMANSIFTIIFKHVKDPVLLERIQDDLDKFKAEEEQKNESLNAFNNDADFPEEKDDDDVEKG